MGKDGFLTPKAIANRIKAKGLQKLRWYCQLCQKQCRDENGFKCHQMSDSHRRQMDLFGMNANKVVDQYSREFEETFLEHLKIRHPFSRVLAKNVYNEFITDRDHVHMNSTQWLTLTDFVKHLGKEGKCKVEESEKGWWITLIMKDPMQEIEEGKKLKRTVAEKEEEERHLAEMFAQVERAKKRARSEGDEEQPTADALVKTDDAPIVLSLAPGGAAGAAAGPEPGAAGPSGAGLPPRAPVRPAMRAKPAVNAFGDDDDGTGGPSGSGQAPSKLSKLDQIMKQDLEAKARQAADKAKGSSGRLPHWLFPGITVKVMSKELQEHGYYKKKGVIERVIDKFVGEVAMLDSGDVVRVDQAQLETVIPQPGGQVLVVNGPHRGWKAVLQEINTDKYRALIKMSEGPATGTEVWADYEDICKKSSA